MRRLSLQEAEEIDNRAIYELGIPRVALMENAGRGVAEFLLKMCKRPSSVLIVSGGGYNGGDGLVAARHLYINNLDIAVFLAADIRKVKDETLIQLNILKGLGLKIRYIEDICDIKSLRSEIKRRDFLIDALMGIGFRGSIREPQKSIIESINRSKIKVLSVDSPSGLDLASKTPESRGIKADWTVTFKAAKRAMVSKAGKELCGRIHTVGIGI
jgi:hydroxyethylthiazole kinase-like uncharacterized protein yjeF